MNPDQNLHIKIISPAETIYEATAQSLSSVNSNGKFDILPEHANFISIVENQPITIRLPDKKEQQFTFPLAIIYTTQNNVTIYTDIQNLPKLT